MIALTTDTPLHLQNHPQTQKSRGVNPRDRHGSTHSCGFPSFPCHSRNH